MTRDISELQQELAELSPKQKAELARTLIDSLDENLDENVEQLWLDKATQRYEAYRRGEISSLPVRQRRYLHEFGRDSGGERPFPRFGRRGDAGGGPDLR